MNVQKVNYQKELEKLLNKITEEGRTPSLLLHSCDGVSFRIFFDYDLLL